ncbi:MAG TPA: methylenetetrahydrofolate reductase [Candidatus Dormibacteraeota bacterium]|nr:methylenetetrahydrofolate reductase [Candidatus Dormibacteraeota bacterium]
MTDPSVTHQRRLVAGAILRQGSMAPYRAIEAAEGEKHSMRPDLVDSDIGEHFRIGTALACMAHLTDLHVTDAQSPARFEFINREYRDPRFRELLPMHRPQEALNAHAVAAMVRALNAIDGAPITGSPIGLAIMSGDAVDNAQSNELANFAALLAGGDVRPDSGGALYEGVQSPGWPDESFWKPDVGIKGEDHMREAYGFPDAPGLLERALRPFHSNGLRMPWLGCHGNHEEVCQGVGIVTPELAERMVGLHKPIRLPDGLDRDKALETFVRRPEAFMAGPDIRVAPDADRRPFTRAEFAAAIRQNGTTYYVHDTATIRCIVLDTTCSAGGADGCIDEDQVRWLERRLKETDRPVVVTSHHTLETLGNKRRAHGPRYIDADELLDMVHGAGNVVLWLNGHVHANAIRPRPDPRGSGGGFWEVTTSSLVDWPCQARVVEIFEAGDGLLAIACTMVDHDGSTDPGEAVESAQMAGLHRQLAGNVPLAGFDSGRSGTPLDRNVILPVRWTAGRVARGATVPYSATSRAARVVIGRARSGLGAPARLLGRIGVGDETSHEGLISLLTAPRYEVLPTEDVEARILAHVPKDVTITVTASPRRGIDATVSLAERLAKQGYQVVPHISARLIRDRAHLREVLDRVVALGTRDVFIVAGDAKEPAGDYPDSVSLLTAITGESHGLKEIGVTGYPERHSFIEDDLTIQAMWDKRRIATYIVSNLCFSPRVVKKWVARVRRRGVELPIHVGLAGVADPAKLLRISTRIGLGDSARFLRGHSNWFMRMMRPGGYDPERFATGLLPELAAPARNVAGLHFFTFNEIEATERWRQETLARLRASG